MAKEENIGKMEIVYVSLEKIKPYKKNAKIHTTAQIKQIAKSIRELGFNDPIALDEKFVIIEGHGRFLAAQQLDMKKVPCIILSHMSKKQKRAYIIAHNKLTMNTGFDQDILNLELSYLGEDNDIDLELTGFSEVELLEAMEDVTPDKYDSGEFKEYEERANEEDLKSTNVIICCVSEKDVRWLMKLIGEDKKLKKRYTTKEIRKMRKAAQE